MNTSVIAGQSQLIASGILTSTGEISKDKINLISGAYIPEFAETVWTLTDGDPDTQTRMFDIFNQLFSEGREDEMLDLLRLLYDVVGLAFPADVGLLAEHPEARRYFLFSFLLDLDECTQEFMDEATG